MIAVVVAGEEAGVAAGEACVSFCGGSVGFCGFGGGGFWEGDSWEVGMGVFGGGGGGWGGGIDVVDVYWGEAQSVVRG